MLDRFEILYEVKNNAGTQTFTVNESDVPAQEVKAFYVKEAWFFDQNNSVYDVKIIALSPVIYRNLDFGEQHTPMCWVTYDDVKTHLANNYIMTSNLNNAKNLNMDDYFRKRMFEGEIVRTENLLNLPLQAYCPTPDSMAKEQERIEKELESFQESLWIIPDTTTQIVLSSKDAKKVAKEAKKNAGKEKSESKDKATTKDKATKEKPAAASKSDTTPTRSVRRSR
jgi:gliding motility associated protien GldN